MKHAFVITMTGLVLALVACADLFDSASQCASDRDCEKFQATCDLARAVCVPYGSQADSGDDDLGATESPDADLDALVVDQRCTLPNKESATVPTTPPDDAGDAQITGDVSLGCEKDWNLKSRVFVKQGGRLTIAAGTTIRAEANAGIVVEPGGKIIARGTRDLPIVMVPSTAGGTPKPGDWLGLIVLGNAPPAGNYAGNADYPYGGTAADDDSGVISFVRLEYPSAGVGFGGLGTGTKIDHVEVRKSNDNCFTILGGAVDAKYLVCQYAADDLFEVGGGYKGRLQFLYGQKTPLAGAEHHGLLVDGAGTSPVIYNLTLCGDDKPNLGYGLVFRNGTSIDLNGAIVSGWFAGFDVVGAAGPNVEVRGSIMAGNATNPAYDENQNTDDTQPTFDDDNGFAELGFFGDGARANKTTDPKLSACYDPSSPAPWPNAAITGGARTPPDDGFFEIDAKYIGAFKDAADGWMKGAWVDFGED